MTGPEESPFSHPFMLPHDFEMFKPIIERQTKTVFPSTAQIDEIFTRLADGLNFFGEAEKARLSAFTGQEMCGVEIGYLLADQVFAFNPEFADSQRTLVEVLVEDGIEDIEVVKKTAHRVRLVRQTNGLKDARVLMQELASDPVVIAEGNNYLLSVENATREAWKAFIKLYE